MAHIAAVFAYSRGFKCFIYSGVGEQIELALPDSSDSFVLPSVSCLERAVLLCGFAAKITS